ncbi:MAG: hypothetical protein QI197_02660 [Candidatus Korarchaeota archaeon]|nr:hypothetical protein [Candidatus Korarchaeota archaeon]
MWLEKTFTDLTRGLGDWVTSFELLIGKAHVSPILSLLITVFLVSIPSFSSDAIQLAYLSIVSTLWGFWFVGRAWTRFLKISMMWAIFTSVIMLPKVYLSGSLDPLMTPLRVLSSLLVLEASATLFGTKSIFEGLALIAPQLPESLDIMLGQISYYLRNIGWLIIAKGSRNFDESPSMRYEVISLAASELLNRGRERAFSISLAKRSRTWNSIPDSSLEKRDIILMLVFLLSMSLSCARWVL